MSQYQIGFIVGSLRKESYNLKLAQALIHLLPENATGSVIDIASLPFYNQDLDGKDSDTVKAFKDSVKEKHGIVFLSPEYNRSISGVLKNALDIGSRPYGKSVWQGKVAGVIGTSPGAIGTALAQQHLRTIVAALDMPTLNHPEMFVQWKDGMVDEQGQVSEGSREFLQKWVNAYVAWLQAHA